MKIVFNNKRGFNDSLNTFMKKIKVEVGPKYEAQILRFIMKTLAERTPVWSGDTVSNYAVGVNKAPTTYKQVSPSSFGEKNRPSAENVMMQKTEEVISRLKKLENIEISNNVLSNKEKPPTKKWDKIDAGAAPTKALARNPGGVSDITVSRVREKFGITK